MDVSLKHYNHISKLKTTKGIANYLLKYGFKGEIGRAASCPISQCVKAVNPKATVATGPYELSVSGSMAPFRMGHPPIIIVFIREFDAGCYPYLVRLGPTH